MTLARTSEEPAPARPATIVRSLMSPLVIGVLTLLSAALVFGFPPGPARIAAASFIVALGPGLGIVPLCRVHDHVVNAVLVPMCSIAVNVLVAQVVMYVRGFTWRPCAVIVVIITLIGVCLQAVLVGLDPETRL